MKESQDIQTIPSRKFRVIYCVQCGTPRIVSRGNHHRTVRCEEHQKEHRQAYNTAQMRKWRAAGRKRR